MKVQVNNMAEKKKISRATMARFPIYLKALRAMGHIGKDNFLSSELAEVTHIQDTTIRRDFGFLPQKETLGKRGYGYDTNHMIEALSEMLGLGLDDLGRGLDGHEQQGAEARLVALRQPFQQLLGLGQLFGGPAVVAHVVMGEGQVVDQ